MHIAILTPDGVGIRNFVGVFLKRFEGSATVLHETPGSLLEEMAAGAAASIGWARLIPAKERPLSFTLRQMLTYAHVFWGDTQAMRYTRARKLGGSWKTVAANRTAKFLGRLAASSGGVRLLERAYFGAVKRLPEVESYRRLFQEISPAVVVSSSQQSARVLAPVLAAKSLGIPTVAFVASWDNLTSKGRIAAPFDHFLVWGRQMQCELLRFYPHISNDRVHVVGTPQFDPYADDSLLWPRDEFFHRAGADPGRPLICFSGGDEGTCPEDQHHVRILLDAIRSGKIRRRPQVLLRPCPVDPGSRYDEVRKRYPELLYARPEWAQPEPQAWARCIPTLEDMRFLANLTHHSDLNVNLASTMTLDFSIKDKPIVNVAFDVNSPPPLRVPLWDLYYQWEHYSPVVKLGAARFARSPEELVEHVNLGLDNPTADREGRSKLVALQVGVPVGQSSAAIAEVLARVAASSRAAFSEDTCKLVDLVAEPRP